MSGKYHWDQLLQSAIYYAKEGFPVTPSQEYWTNVNLDQADDEFRHLQRFSEFRKIFLKTNGLVYQAGDIMKQSDLAMTLEGIAKEGSSWFYRGEISKMIVDDLQVNGGLFNLS